jgi:nitrite reductase/ring-hydroxylating ferredoxin subunit
MTGTAGGTTWIDAGGIDELRRRRKVVVQHGDEEILLLVHDGQVRAFANRCIHRQRELAKGVVLNGRLVCPGHQWAFDLDTGWEAVKGECQPTFEVKVDGGRVLVDPTSRARRGGPAGEVHRSAPR